MEVKIGAKCVLVVFPVTKCLAYRFNYKRRKKEFRNWQIDLTKDRT
jgi:hypothetical protein